jgi:hypothetical protein
MTKYLRKSTKGEKIYFGSWLQRFQSMVGFSIPMGYGEAEDQGSRRV